jgi:hypothetical protein
MAWTSWGFDGTINEAQWSQMAGLLGNGYVAAGNGDCLVTAVGGARSVSVAAGTLYGDGVVSVNSGAETVAMTTPVNGQWYVIALRRTWATNTAALVAIAGATTSTTTPTVAPTSFPTLNTSPGTLTDQPIAWAWCNSANTTVVVFDIRLKAVKSMPPVVATAAERDAKFMAPTQGLQVWRNDLGVAETWYDLYNVSTNPGGRSAAGYYQEPIGRVLQVVYGTTTTEITTTTGTPTDTGLTATITPKYANSRILVIIEQVCQPVSISNGYTAGVRIMRDATDLGATYLTANAGVGAGGALAIQSPISLVQIDSPNTLSAVTYKTQAWIASGLRIVTQTGSTRSTITLVEVAA